MRGGGELTRALEPVLGHVGALAMAFVAAAGLAQRRVGTCHVEDVVNDLKEHTELRSKTTELDCLRFRRREKFQHALDRRGDQPAGLQRVQPAQPVGPRGSELLDVQVLAPDHAVDARGAGEQADRAQQRLRLRALLGREVAQRLRVERVAGEDRDVVAVYLVAGRAAAAQVVVVHHREVVMDKRIRVDQLERRRQRHHLVALVADRERGGDRQHRPDPLASRQQRVAHRLRQTGEVLLVGEAHLLQIRVDANAQVVGIGH